MLCPCKCINGEGQNTLFRVIFSIDFDEDARVCGKIWFWPVVSMLMRTVLTHANEHKLRLYTMENIFRKSFLKCQFYIWIKL